MALNNNQVRDAFSIFKRLKSKTCYMIKRAAKVKLIPSLLILFMVFVVSCRKFEGDLQLPSYLRIDSIQVNTDPDLQGSPSENITTAFIYVDDQIVGIYELPTVAPILAEGTHKVRIDAGINMNGSKSYRVYYPFYKAIIQDIDFTSLDTIDLNGSQYISNTSYWDNTQFLWMVDFEDPSYNLDSIQTSTVDIERTPKDDPEAYLEYNSHYSGVIKLTADKSLFYIASNAESGEGFKLERLQNIPIFLEVNFKCTNVFTFGVFANGSSVEPKDVLVFNETAEWKKIYINLKPVVDASVNAVDFNMYFKGVHYTGADTTYIYLDNIKLITR